MHRDDKDLVFAGLSVTYKNGIVWNGNDANAVWATNTVGASWKAEPFPHDASLLFDGDDDSLFVSRSKTTPGGYVDVEFSDYVVIKEIILKLKGKKWTDLSRYIDLCARLD